MTVDELVEQGNAIWGKKEMSLEAVAVALGVVQGDVCRQARNKQEGRAVNDFEAKKELGNMIFSTIRWCSDLGYDPNECIELAKEAQKQYAMRPQ